MRLKADKPSGDRRAGHVRALTAALGSAEGSQLLEFALVLPLLLVLLVGIFDFATAFNLKQIMNNATREGARIGSAQERSDLTQPTPPGPASVQVIRDAVVSYLGNAGVRTNFITDHPMTSAGAGTFTWTYSDSNGYGLKIERNVVLLDVHTGGVMQATRVTLRYPYDWSFGFNKTIKLLLPAANYSETLAINTNTLMANK